MKRRFLIAGLFLLALGVFPVLGERLVEGAFASSAYAWEQVGAAAGRDHNSDRSQGDAVTATRRKSRAVHLATGRQLGGAASAPSSPKLILPPSSEPKIVDECTAPAVHWTNYHSVILANPPPSRG